MAPQFVIPNNLKDLEEENPTEDRLFAREIVQIDSLSVSEFDELVKGLAFELSEKELLCVEDQGIFDQLYSVVKFYSHIEPSAKGSLIDSLKTNLAVLLPTINALPSRSPSQKLDGARLQEHLNSHRNALKIYIYFLQTIIFLEDAQPEVTARSNNTKGKTSRRKHFPQPWNWESLRPKVLEVLATAVESDLNQLFRQANLEDNFLSFVARGAFSMLENAASLRDKDTKESLCRIIAACSTKYNYTTQSAASLLHLIHKFEHLPQHIADAVAIAELRYQDGRLAIALIREIGRMNPKDYARDSTGAENVGRFLVELADRLPKLVSTNVGMLMPHFGGESYKIRSSLVGVFGKLIAKAFKDTGEASNNGIHRLRSKQAMLDILIERCRDVSAYTRSRVLQTWGELCEEHAVSMGLWNRVSEIAASRLEDKSAVVRKSALNLLTTLLQYNPFGPQLRTASFEVTLEKYKKKLEGMQSTGTSNDSQQNTVSVKSEKVVHEDGETIFDKESESDENNSIEKDEESCIEDSNNAEDGGESHAAPQGDRDDSAPDIGNLEQTRALVASLEAGVRFAKCIASTMPVLVQLLASPLATDVGHAIQLLMRCRQFQIEGAELSLRKMFPLVFSQEKAISEAVENAFVSIYIRKSSMETAANLINITIDASIGDLAALELIISTLVTKGDIAAGTIAALWDFFTFNVNGIRAEESRGALSVLCMAAKSSPKILRSHLLNIVDIGFGRWAKEEPLLARTACIALQRLSEEDRDTLLSSHGRIFNVLQGLLTGSEIPEQSWYSAAEQAINAIYALHPKPEAFLASVIKKLHSIVFGPIEVEGAEKVVDGEKASLDYVEVTKLSRYLFVISHIALKHLVYIESCVRRIRKQRSEKERAAAEAQATKLSESDSAEALGAAENETNINAELGVSASEDARLDSLSERAEKEIVTGGQNEKFIIGSCAPIVAKLCRNFNLLHKYPELQTPAMLALCKLMVIDADFCDANLQLLFTVTQNALSDIVRSNCVIALGDLAVRFPNLLEPWTEHMYARLHDKSLSVRKNAVLVLSHLILNDMMKVKGYISEMALCIEDEDTRISNLAKLFFHELSKKGNNPIYNLLPDILSRLSQQNLPEENFCNIMQFLIGSIKKDKQMEGLIEKLCHRFSGVTEKKHWIDLAYCLSQLTYTEKGLRRLGDLFKNYEHSLADEAVISYFRSITNKAKKYAKPELKSYIEEFEEKLVKCHEERKEQEETLHNARSHQMKLSATTEASKSSEYEGSCITGNANANMEPKMVNTISSEACQGSLDFGNTIESVSDDLTDSKNSEHDSALVAPTSCLQHLNGETKSIEVKEEDSTLKAKSESSVAIQSESLPSQGTPSQEREDEAQSQRKGKLACQKERIPKSTIAKGPSRLKKSLNIQDENEGSDRIGVLEEEKENKSRRALKTPRHTPATRRTRNSQKDQIAQPTMSLRRRG